MWLNGEEQDAGNLFWEWAGEVEPFPRHLERPIALALPLAIVKMPHLALGGIETWLRSRQIDYSFDCDSRFVRGCLIAFNGKGITGKPRRIFRPFTKQEGIPEFSPDSITNETWWVCFSP